MLLRKLRLKSLGVLRHQEAEALGEILIYAVPKGKILRIKTGDNCYLLEIDEELRAQCVAGLVQFRPDPKTGKVGFLGIMMICPPVIRIGDPIILDNEYTSSPVTEIALL